MITLEDLTVIHAPIERCFDLARSVEVHLAGNVHSGESAKAIAGVTSGLVGLAERVTWRAKLLWRLAQSHIEDSPSIRTDAGFQFLFAEWAGAARELVARWREGRR
jgi:hypothetical protein